MKTMIGGFLLSLLLSAIACAQMLMPVNLMVEGQLDPVGVGESKPLLAWTLRSSDPTVRGQEQSAYQIRVATSLANLKKGDADLWDSGKVHTEQNNQIVYAGRPLGSGQQCWWEVRTWNKNGDGGLWSKPATWSAGLLARPDWKALWIGMDAESLGHLPPAHLVGCQWVWTDEPADSPDAKFAMFRGHLKLPPSRKVQTAILSIAAGGHFQAWVNGHRTLHGDDLHTLFTRDISARLIPGDNLIAVSVNNRGGLAGLAGRLEIYFTSGRPMVINIDQNWKATSDEQPDAQQLNFDDSDWKPVTSLAPVGREPWGVPTESRPPMDPAVYLRRSFLIEKKITRATLYTTALGMYDLRLDAHKLGSDQLLPGYSDYRKRVYYNSFDVTSRIHLGHNVIAAVLTDGWYAGYWDETHRTHNYGGDPRFLAQLEIQYADGTTKCIVTDKSWKVSLGPIRQSDMVNGSTYDARQDLGGWDYPLYNDSSWKQPKIGLNGPEPLIDASLISPAREQESISPRSIREVFPAVYLIDFGNEVAGRIRIHARGHAGEAFEIHYASHVDRDGAFPLDQTTRASDVYVFRDSSPITWEPIMTRHQFRYIEIAGLATRPQLSDIQAIAIYPDTERTGWFTCSNRHIDRLYQQALANTRSQSADEPQAIFANSYSYDSDLLCSKILINLNDLSAIRQGGVISASSPLDHHDSHTMAQDAQPMLVSHLWQTYDDLRVVRRNYAHLGGFLDDLKTNWQIYAHQDRFLRDWPAKNSDNDAELISLAYTAHVADLMSNMADAIGEKPDAENDQRIRQEFIDLFQKKLHDAGKARHSPTVYILALSFHLAPDNQRQAMTDQLISQIREDNWQSSVGCLGQSQLLQVLDQAGQMRLAYQILRRDKNSCLAAGPWIFETLGGINQVSPGFRHILIAPQVLDGISSARATYNSASGPIQCSWRVDQQTIQLNVTVPINDQALVHIPTSDAKSVQESDQPADQASGVSFIGYQKNAAVYLVGSGHYAFSAQFR